MKKYESLYDIFLISERIMDKMCIKKTRSSHLFPFQCV